MRIVLLLAVVLVLVALVYLVAAGNARGAQRLRVAQQRVREVTDVAYAHDEISAGLASAVIDRTRGLGPDSSVHSLESAVEDVLALARQHRVDEPDLAVILIDTARREEPRQLG